MTDTIRDSLPSAQEARAAYAKSLGTKVQEETQRVVRIIREAQQGENLTVTIHPPIRFESIERQLRQHGYGVTARRTGENETSTVVEW